MYLLDTNICIYFMKNAYPVLTEKILSCNPSELYVSSVTIFELEYGAAKSNWGDRTRRKLAMFLAPFTILPFTADDAVEAGNIRAFLEAKGTIIGPYDIQLAAQAISNKLVLLTHNTSEFSRVPKLKLEDLVDE